MTEPSDIPAAFEKAVKARLDALQHDAPDPEIVGAPNLAAQDGGLALHLVLDDTGKKVHEAWFTAPEQSAEAAILDKLCDYAIGATVRELAEHGLIYVIRDLLDPSLPAPVPGILTPRNAGECFEAPRRLLSKIRQEAETVFGKAEGTNFFDRPFSAHWKALDKDGKRALVAPHIESFRNARKIADDAFELVEIDQYDRLFLVFSDAFPVWEKPAMLMDLERWLRERTGERIELFTEVVKDANRIRRL